MYDLTDNILEKSLAQQRFEPRSPLIPYKFSATELLGDSKYESRFKFF